MKFLCVFVVFVIFVMINNSSYALSNIGHNHYVTIELEKIFQAEFKKDENILYKTVPRGLIVSFPEEYFFDENFIVNKDKLKQIANLIKRINLPCVIEVNTKNGDRKSSLESSIMRAQLIVEYLIKKQDINQKQIRSIGFGNIIPYKNFGQIYPDYDNRVDVVILYY